MLLSFDVERQISIAALDAAMDADRSIFLLAQRYKRRRSEVEDLYIIGTVCFIKQYSGCPGQHKSYGGRQAQGKTGSGFQQISLFRCGNRENS